MGDHGDEAVVVLRGEDEHVGPELGHHALQPVEGVEVGRTGRGQHPHRALEEVGGGPAQADLLGSGHRVAPDEAGVVGRRHDGGLDPADVGDHRIGPALRRGQDPADLLGHRRGRGGDEDDLGLEVVAGLVDDPRLERLGQSVRGRRRAR